jgi:hypothetical protein
MLMKPKTATPSSKSSATRTPSAKRPATKAAKPRSAAAPSSKASPSAKKPASTGARVKASASTPRRVTAQPPATEPTAAATEQHASPPLQSKQSQIITLLRGDSGASMPQLMTLTGWQSHTVRGMLSGSLRKRLGLNVQCQRVDGTRIYRIVPEVSGQ